MGENSKIEWTHHTFNPWRGCTKVSAGCANCYAEREAARNPAVLGVWGNDGTRIVASDSGWNEPRKWDRKARDAGERRRVFCASLADVFEEREDVETARAVLLNLICETPHLDWLLLTKRPQAIAKLLNQARQRLFELQSHDGRVMVEQWLKGNPPKNVWLGVSVENQATADERIPILLHTAAAVRFCSYEPALGPVDFSRIHLGQSGFEPIGEQLAGIDTLNFYLDSLRGAPKTGIPGLDWIIFGGESGPKARPCNLDWAYQTMNQCREHGIMFFMKQTGRHVHSRAPTGDVWSWFPNDKKGGDVDEMPEDLRVREIPGNGVTNAK